MCIRDRVKIDGIGDKMAEKFTEYFSDKENVEKLDRLLQEVTIKNPEVNHNAQNMEGLNFVVTGSVSHFANRNEVKEYIEQRGGKVRCV